MKISRYGKNYIKKNGRHELLLTLEQNRLSSLLDKRDFLYWIEFLGAYYIHTAALNEEDREKLYERFCNAVKGDLHTLEVTERRK